MGPRPAVAQVRRAVRTSLATSVRELTTAKVLVACSGGADSLALAAAVAFEAPRVDVAAGLITVDHGLQDGSAARAAEVAAIGRELGLDPVRVVRVEVGGPGGPEAAARRARYGALTEAAEALDAQVLLGHTRDDQAETVLLGLGRGSGPRSIAGMLPASGRYLRPLLAISRQTTRAACDALGLSPWDDPHNADPRFRRVRIRHELLPLAEDVLGGGVAAALARTAQQLRQDLDALDALAAAEVSRRRTEAGGLSGLAGLATSPVAIRSRVLRGWALAGGVPHLFAAQLDALDALVVGWHGQGPCQLPGGFQAVRSSGTLMLLPPSTASGE
ncbi:MAG TPA: tRNA lysidine(34) synthetase TilS [Jatrophihabitantaceae bacterium]|jgi:tRNA(Ile)-lysidine synthase|nr:tRNA lysidine(34) synthetase TilS [Jatrophihabitantaceae bacterium]